LMFNLNMLISPFNFNYRNQEKKINDIFINRNNNAKLKYI